jgi:hypothetical protein
VAYDIRPLSFTEVLDRAFAMLRDQFWLLVGISAVMWIPYGALLALAGTTGLALRAVASVVLLMLLPVEHCALTMAVANVYLGTSTTVSEAYRSTRPILGSIIGTYLLMFLFVLLAAVLVIPAIYLLVCWTLVTPVMIVENSFGMSGLRRSRALVHNSWWKTLGLIVVVSFIASVPAGALEVFWSFIPFLGPILNAATTGVTSSYSLVAVVIYYFDRRCRTEDFDLRILAQQIRSEAAGAMPRTSIA